MSRRFCSTDMYKIPTISARIHPIGIEIQIPVTPIKLENRYAKATRSKADTVFVAGTVILCHKGGECIAKILQRLPGSAQRHERLPLSELPSPVII